MQPNAGNDWPVSSMPRADSTISSLFIVEKRWPPGQRRATKRTELAITLSRVLGLTSGGLRDDSVAERDACRYRALALVDVLAKVFSITCPQVARAPRSSSIGHSAANVVPHNAAAATAYIAAWYRGYHEKQAPARASTPVYRITLRWLESQANLLEPPVFPWGQFQQLA